mgnify:CR=1 FL=1
MPYIGKTPTVGNFQVCDAISVVNGQAAYTLQVGGVNVAPESANHMLVSLNGILQKPGSSFTISGSTMTFASNLATGDVIDFVQILGNVLDLGTPSDDTVTAAKLNNDIISGQTALSSEPADTDEFLVSDAGTLKRIDYSLIKGGGSFNLLQTTTVSSGVSTVAFTSNIDSTYKNYMIQITECHPADDGQRFNFRLYSSEGSPDSGAAYMYGGIGKRSDNTATDHNSTGTNQGQITCDPVGGAAAESFSATIYLYNPSGTTFYKNIDVDAVVMNASGHVIMNRSANNYNETVAYTGISFFFDSGNIDAGTFKLYGIS